MCTCSARALCSGAIRMVAWAACPKEPPKYDSAGTISDTPSLNSARKFTCAASSPANNRFASTIEYVPMSRNSSDWSSAALMRISSQKHLGRIEGSHEQPKGLRGARDDCVLRSHDLPFPGTL